MTRITRVAAAMTTAAAVAAIALPASAQYANEYIPAKLIKQGSTTLPIAGAGTVIVQVEVHADGTHKATRVIRSTNPHDNSAAMDIANNSTFRPAHRGSKPVLALYDFTLRFKGGGVAAAGSAATAGGVAGDVDKLLRAGKYEDAKSKAEAGLQSNPNDSLLNQELGAANYFLTDYPAAADAFSKVDSVSGEFAPVAAQSYQLAAAKLATTNSTQAVQYGQKAVAMDPSGAGAYYSLGAAQLGAGDTASAVTNLKKAHDLAFADSKMSVTDRVSIDSELLAAYTKAGDSAQAQQIAAEMKRLAPTSNAAQTVLANQYLAQGTAASKAGNHEDAINAFEQAAATGVPDAIVTANVEAAFEESKLAKPDYAKMKAYADKALAVQNDNAAANFAEGVALFGQYATNGQADPNLKSAAVNALNKAKGEAQAQNNATLTANINSFMQTNIK